MTSTIQTVEQLDALPAGSVVVHEHTGAVFTSLPRPGVQSPSWIQPGSRYEATSDEVPLPVVLVWSPFECWSKQVDVAVIHRLGVSVHDLPDIPFRDWFDEGFTPAEVAEMVGEAA